MFHIFDGKKRKLLANFTREDIPKLRYGMLNSILDECEGVSIVMGQIEKVLVNNLKVPNSNIFYLVGKSCVKSHRIIENEILWSKNDANVLALKNYKKGYGGGSSEIIEIAINKAKKAIEDFVLKNKIDVLISHNSAYPTNFISAIALSRFYRDSIREGKFTPKYILWWHDSYLDKKDFMNPPRDVENYLLQGVPGCLVEYIIFINSLQFEEAKKYFKKIDLRTPGFYRQIEKNHDVVYNTAETSIEKFEDLESEGFNQRVEKFINEFEIKELLEKNNLDLNEVLFCLQHSRVVKRKRIDFALQYCYGLLKELRKKKMQKAIYFLISGHDGDDSRKDLEKLNDKLKKKYEEKNLFLVFAEDYEKKTTLTFEEYPKIFSKLGGIATYFSESEGFGNNLLEVLASGLIPAVYNYPVYKKDISKFKFKVITFNKFEIDSQKISETINLLKMKSKRKNWVDYNIEVLKKNFHHDTIAVKLIQAITSERTHN